MYADRYGRTGIKSGSLSVAVAINGAVLAALLLSAPETFNRTPPDELGVKLIPLSLPPEPEPLPQPEPRAEALRPAPPIDAPTRIVEITPTEAPVVAARPFTPFTPGEAVGAGTGVTVDPPRPAPPLITGPAVDPRYAGDFQPDYPSAERRAGREGTVVVRALIGTDGRVKRLERVSATSDAFWRATEQRALSRWRFTPGTRDGVPVEAWRRMSLTFVLRD